MHSKVLKKTDEVKIDLWYMTLRLIISHLFYPLFFILIQSNLRWCEATGVHIRLIPTDVYQVFRFKTMTEWWLITLMAYGNTPKYNPLPFPKKTYPQSPVTRLDLIGPHVLKIVVPNFLTAETGQTHWAIAAYSYAWTPHCILSCLSKHINPEHQPSTIALHQWALGCSLTVFSVCGGSDVVTLFWSTHSLILLVLLSFSCLMWAGALIPCNIHKEGQDHMDSYHCHDGSIEITVIAGIPRSFKNIWFWCKI